MDADIVNEVVDECNSTHKINSSSVISQIPVEITVCVGKLTITIDDLMQLSEGDVLALTSKTSDPFDIKVNNQKVAEGELVESNEEFFIKITNVLDIESRNG